MTKQEYKNLLSRRFETWTTQECREADRYVKQYALRNFTKGIKKLNIPLNIQEYLQAVVQAQFFSYDTEKLLNEMGCFPARKSDIPADTDNCSDCQYNKTCDSRETPDFPRNYAEQPYCTGHSKHQGTDFSKHD